MKILSLYYMHKPGGFCKRLYRLLNALANAEHEVHYLCLEKQEGLLDPKVKIHKIPFPFENRKSLVFWAVFTIWCPLFAAYKVLSIKPERYVVFGAYYSLVLMLARFFNPGVLVLFVRSLVFRTELLNQRPYLIRKLSNLVDQIGINSASRVVLLTETMRRELEKFIGHELQGYRILPNDAPPVKAIAQKEEILSKLSLANISDKVLVCLCAGVLNPGKNIDILVKVFEKLNNKPICLLVAGDGPMLATLRETSPANVHFLGWYEPMYELYSCADLFLHASIDEGMPNVVLEALAHNLPILGANTSEFREVLNSEQNVFAAKDSNDLVSKLQNLLENPAKLKELAELSRIALKKFNFNWEQAALTLIKEEIP